MTKSFFGLKETNVMVEFRITGDEFDLNYITQRLSITPSDFWIKGNLIKNRDILRQYTCWALSTGYSESLDINNQLDIIISKLGTKKDVLLEIKRICNVNYRIDIVINIKNNQVPAIYLTSSSIEFAHYINAMYDFDLYVY